MFKSLIEDHGHNVVMATIGSTTTKAGASASVLGWLISQEVRLFGRGNYQLQKKESNG